MTTETALEKARALLKRDHHGVLIHHGENAIAAALKRTYAAALLAGHQMRGLQVIHEQHRIQKEADALEKGSE